MLKRILSTIGLWGIVAGLLALWGSPEIGVWMVAVMAVLAQNECYRMLERMGFHPFRRIGLVLGAAMILAPHYAKRLLGDSAGVETSVIAVILVVCCARILWQRNPASRFETLHSTVFGLIFVPFMLQFFVKVFWLYGDTAEAHWQGIFAMIWIIAVSKFCDVGAFLVGSAIGKHKMAPSISPNKSWEGAVGGVIMSMGVSALFVWGFQSRFDPSLTPLIAAAFALPIAVTAIVSDLIESIMKRGAEMKDSGRGIPGIGGAFDLMDSLVLTAPVGYLLLLTITR